MPIIVRNQKAHSSVPRLPSHPGLRRPACCSETRPSGSLSRPGGKPNVPATQAHLPARKPASPPASPASPAAIQPKPARPQSPPNHLPSHSLHSAVRSAPAVLHSLSPASAPTPAKNPRPSPQGNPPPPGGPSRRDHHRPVHSDSRDTHAHTHTKRPDEPNRLALLSPRGGERPKIKIKKWPKCPRPWYPRPPSAPGAKLAVSSPLPPPSLLRPAGTHGQVGAL